jgi:Uma2 family endonuclease
MSQIQKILPEEKSIKKQYTLEEYFDLEYQAEYRNEFWDGNIKAMSYTSPEHGEIQTNISDALADCISIKGCKKYVADRMILIPACNKVFYPDLVIVCGEQEFHQHKKNMKATLNPTVLIEILSPSTEEQDRIDKWMCYRTIPTLQQYLMIHQDCASIHSYHRQTEREWHYTYAQTLAESITIMDCRVALEAIYAGIAFQAG